MDIYRFFVPDLPAQLARSSTVLLPEDQARHARQVLRLAPGQSIELFDGHGHFSHATLLAPASNRDLPVRAAPVELSAPARVRLTLATAVPKGDRADWLVEQASQLNVAAIQWLDTDRSVVKPREGGQKIEKWRRLAIESAKQCGRNYLMEILEPRSLEAVLQSAPPSEQILWLDPHETPSPAASGEGEPNAADILALVGPEGGWSPRESALLQAAVVAQRARSIQLTPTILRIETACAAIAAIVMSNNFSP